MQLKLGLNSARGELKKDGSSVHELIEFDLFSMNLYTYIPVSMNSVETSLW